MLNQKRVMKMKVRELIELLGNCNPNDEVLIESNETDFTTNIILETGDLDDWVVLIKEVKK